LPHAGGVMIAASPAAAIAVAALPEFWVSLVPVLRGMPYAPAKANLFRQTGPPLRIAGCNQWILTGSFQRAQYWSTLNSWPVARCRLSIWPRQPHSKQTT